MSDNEPMTLRKLCELLGEEFMDVPLRINVRDGNRNSEQVDIPTSLWGMPRALAIPQTGEPARLALDVHLHNTRLVKRAKAPA